MHSRTASQSPKERSHNTSLYGSLSPSKKAEKLYFPKQVFSYGNSASTLQFSSPTNRFSKSERFTITKSPSNSSTKLILPSTLSTRGPSIGLGNKMIMSQGALRASKELPSPQHYNPKPIASRDLGKSFGQSFEVYRKVYLPNAREVLPEITSELPGPGTYGVTNGFTYRGKGYSLKPKGRMFNEVSRDRAPPSTHYKPNRSLVESHRYNNISFGVGDRVDFTKSQISPGPGTYQLPSKFDEYPRKKIFQERLKERLKGLKM